MPVSALHPAHQALRWLDGGGEGHKALETAAMEWTRDDRLRVNLGQGEIDERQNSS